MLKEIYENFLYIYMTFLEIIIIINLKIKKILKSFTMIIKIMMTKINEKIFKFENLSIFSINNKNELINLSFITLNKLYSIYFKNFENESIYIYFNDNFQLKIFKLKEKTVKLNQLLI